MMLEAVVTVMVAPFVSLASRYSTAANNDDDDNADDDVDEVWMKMDRWLLHTGWGSLGRREFINMAFGCYDLHTILGAPGHTHSLTTPQTARQPHWLALLLLAALTINHYFISQIASWGGPSGIILHTVHTQTIYCQKGYCSRSGANADTFPRRCFLYRPKMSFVPAAATVESNSRFKPRGQHTNATNHPTAHTHTAILATLE
uniref:Putative secreted protein n=1 Tax=Anopheles triannulatus TaxID=58253 RepID=A0A2M4B0J6_9DIPT